MLFYLVSKKGGFMKRQNLNNGKYLISFQREELRQHSTKLLIETLNNLPPEICTQSGNKYNYIITPDVMSLTRDIGYGPYTEKEWLEGELALHAFMAQFETIDL